MKAKHKLLFRRRWHLWAFTTFTCLMMLTSVYVSISEHTLKETRQSLTTLLRQSFKSHRTISRSAIFTTFAPIEVPRTRRPIFELKAEAETLFNYINDAKDLKAIAKHYKMAKVNCASLFHENRVGLDKAMNVTRELRIMKYSGKLTEDFYLKETKNCSNFVQSRGFITSSLSQEEADFPIAFSILLYKNVEQFERLLRAIYRPQNYYCIHVDTSASYKYFQAVDSIISCFPNVIWSPKWIDVVWGEFSTLEPEIQCMKALWTFRWKYFINLTGQEFPLQTNAHLVKVLRTLNGATDAFGSIKNAMKSRWRSWYSPNGLLLTKGQIHVAASRPFVDFILHNQTAQEFLNWTKTTVVPDETFFSSLNHNPQLGIPGTYTGPIDHQDYFSICRFKNWLTGKRADFPCAGHHVRAICILSTGDLYLLSNRTELFANKFFLDEDRVAFGCMEERHFNNTMDDYLGERPFNATYYENLMIVKHRVQ